MYHSTLTTMPIQFGSNTNVSLADMSNLLPVNKSLGVFAVAMQQPAELQVPNVEPPTPPKKPLSPYMTFSKEIWPRVKILNKNATVCEIGAVIGRLWRELDETTKQRYNDAFTLDKQRYDVKLQAYLRATGLQASDLVKPRPKRKEPIKPVISTTIPVCRQVVVSEAGTGITMLKSNGLPPFSVVWSSETGSAQITASNGSTSNAVIPANSNELESFLLTPFCSQQLQSYTFPTALDTSSLSAGTINQLRAINGGIAAVTPNTTARQPSVLEQEAAAAAATEDVESEVIQLRTALSERTLEAQRLTQELDRANRIVEELRELCRDPVAAATGELVTANEVFP